MNTDRMGRRMDPKTQEERCEDEEDGLVLLRMGGMDNRLIPAQLSHLLSHEEISPCGRQKYFISIRSVFRGTQRSISINCS